MAVGDDHTGDFPTRNGDQNGLSVAVDDGAGVNYGYSVFSQKIGVGAPMRHWRRVGGDDPCQVMAQGGRNAGRRDGFGHLFVFIPDGGG